MREGHGELVLNGYGDPFGKMTEFWKWNGWWSHNRVNILNAT